MVCSTHTQTNREATRRHACLRITVLLEYALAVLLLARHSCCVILVVSDYVKQFRFFTPSRHRGAIPVFPAGGDLIP
eukprot:7072336-Prymnesium_polylepis.1